MKITYRLRGMHCQACVNRIKDELSKLEGVKDLDVTLQPQQAVIESESPLNRNSVEQAVESAGDYEVVAVATPADANGESSVETEAFPPDINLGPYYPLMLVIGFLLLGTLLLQLRLEQWSLMRGMADFMGGFFLVFAFFKLLDLEGFAGAFSRYDLVAARSKEYALAYPFIELSLGAAYLIGRGMIWVNLITLVVMLVSAAGVINALRKREQIQCACLGTVIKLPMSTVTLVEDVGMAAMAAVMLLLM